jgi:TPR repeat protein
MNLHRYSDGTLIEKGDAVLRSGVVPARIIDVFEADPISVWLEDAEHPGRSFATAELSDLTLVERNALDFARAGIDWLRTRADSGDAQAQAALGWLYETGVAVDQDDARGVAWYARAAQGGDSIGQFNFALRCERGRGIAMNLAEAARWYLASAEQGVGPAMKNLSNMYRDGRGVDQDIQQAIRWLRAAEAAGCA